MSNLIYPLAILESQRESRSSRVVRDEFEAGNVAVRSLWPANTFKRRFSLTHSGLTLVELDYLVGFHRAMSGQYDSFWYRDNAGRGGNALVRFAADLQPERKSQGFDVRVELEEVAPVAPPPTPFDLVNALGVSPIIWYDPNRETSIAHLGSTIEGDAWDHGPNTRPGIWTSGTTRLAGKTSQWQYWSLTGTAYALTAANLGLISGTKPACSMFMVAKAGTSATDQVFFAQGGFSGSSAMGMRINASNYWTPYIAGSSETWANARELNSPGDTWRSLCCTWSFSNDSMTMYANAVAKTADSQARTFADGKCALGAATGGANKATGSLGQALIFDSTLSLAQVKALHNLFAYQYGLSLVA